MPMLTVWRCPVCATVSEPSISAPTGWITVGGGSGEQTGSEVFDTWQCVATYVQERESEAK